MATITTYLLVSDFECESDALREHPVLEEIQFETVEYTEASSSRYPCLTFVHETPLEERIDFGKSAQELSKAFPASTVMLTEVEERFEHVERVQTRLYKEGMNAGKVEHGYVFNVGGS